MFQIPIVPNIIDTLKGQNGSSSQKIKGTVVLMKKNVLDFNDFHASVLDRVHELFGQGVSLQLISLLMVILVSSLILTACLYLIYFGCIYIKVQKS
jgi:hypothetical protein